MTTAATAQPVYSTGEATKLLGVEKHQLEHLFRSGKLAEVPRVGGSAAVRRGGAWRGPHGASGPWCRRGTHP